MRNSDQSPFRLDTDLISLRSLVAIADLGSFSAAANGVGRTQSAVSLQIAKLEDRLQTKLLERTSRKVAPTPAGELLIAYARRILATADEAATALSAPETAAPFRIGFAEYLAPEYLHTLLGRFRRAHPKLVFELKLGTGFELRDALDDGQLDVVISGPDGGPVGSSHATLLLEEPMVWAAASKPMAAGERPLPLIVMHPRCSYRKMATEALDRAKVDWRIVTEANSIQGVRSAIKARLGVSAIAQSAAKGLCILADPLPALPATAMVAFIAQPQHPLSQRFVEFLKEGVATEPLQVAAE